MIWKKCEGEIKIKNKYVNKKANKDTKCGIITK